MVLRLKVFQSSSLFAIVAWTLSAALICTMEPLVIRQVQAASHESVKTTVQHPTLKYDVKLEIDDDPSALSEAIRANSVLVQHQQRGVHDLASLIVRARADEKQLQAVLFEEAHYGGSIVVTIDGTSLDAVNLAGLAGSHARPIPVTIAIDRGPQFLLGDISIKRVAAKQSRQREAGVSVPTDDYGLVSGAVARSETVVTAIDRIIQRWRRAGFPFARIHDKTIIADHARRRLDVSIAVAPGSRAVYGRIEVTGTQKLKNKIIVDQSALRSGAPYNPEDLANVRERLRKLDIVQSVRIIEGKELDGNGGIPITIEVTERKPRYIGITASLTTLDGGETKAHWGHRNVFGSGENLRVEGALSQIGSTPLDKLEFDTSATLTKPGVLDIDTSLFVQFRLKREANDAFLSDTVSSKIGLTRRYSPYVSGSLAIENRYIIEENETGDTTYSLTSLPAEATFDSRNNRLDPAKGINGKAWLVPIVDMTEGKTFLVAQFDVARYWSLDKEDRAIVAFRFRGGSILGSELEDIPSSYRFLAGGGNSARGYEYRSIGPKVGGQVISGMSFASSSAELRLRPIKQIGVVPFVDIATVSLDRVPKFTDKIHVGAGLGIRYHTMFGPLRIDTAVPLTNNDDRSKFSLYVGLGQAF